MHPALRQWLGAAAAIRAKAAALWAWLDLAAVIQAAWAAVAPCRRRAGHAARAFLAARRARARWRLRAFAVIAGPMLHMFAGEVHASLTRVFAYGCALAAFALVGVELMTLARGSVMAEAAPDSEWTEVNRPFAAFAMSVPELDAPRYSIWRHASGRGRKDILAFGDLAASGATAMVELYRPGTEPGAEDDDITAGIAELRLSGRPALPSTIETKFGAVSVDPFRDRGPHGERHCLKFARSFDEPRFEISGWYCNAGQELVDRGMIACALDHLTLIAAASEPKLGALFAAAERRRTFCGANNVFLAATPKRHDWIEAERDPRLRGRK